MPVGDIVERNHRAPIVFEQHNINYCSRPAAPLSEACADASVDLDAVIAELERVHDESPATLPTTAWDLDQIVDFVVNHHHRYVRDTLPILRAWCTRLAAGHGDEHPELGEIAALVEELDSELTPHLVKEERILFPWIVRLAEARRDHQPVGPSPFGTVLHPIRAMEAEHERADEIVGMLRALTGNFTAPDDTCRTWRLCWAELDRFDRDLRNHVLLENHILFPRALELERTLA